MNRLTKQLVEIAFRLVAHDKANKAALAAGKRGEPMPKPVLDYVRAMAGLPEPSPTGKLFDDATDEQLHAIKRAGVTLDWFARGGCPIVTLDQQTALGFASAAPPHHDGPRPWPLGVVYAFSIGDGVVLVRHQMVPTRMPESMRPHFTFRGDSVPTEAWFNGLSQFGDGDALANLVENVGAALLQRPEGLAITERHPSRQSARKQGQNPDHIPAVEFVIGSELSLGTRRSGGEDDEEPGGVDSGRSMKVRTLVTPHWTHQVCGPRGSERRLQWIPTHWRGPGDAPISVHATRVLGTENAAPSVRKQRK
jgi:hypothetical protein